MLNGEGCGVDEACELMARRRVGRSARSRGSEVRVARVTSFRFRDAQSRRKRQKSYAATCFHCVTSLTPDTTGVALLSASGFPWAVRPPKLTQPSRGSHQGSLGYRYGPEM